MIAFLCLWVLAVLMLPIFRDLREDESTVIIPFTFDVAVVILGFIGFIVIEVPSGIEVRIGVVSIASLAALLIYKWRLVWSKVRSELELDLRALKTIGVVGSSKRKGGLSFRYLDLFRILVVAYFGSTFLIAIGSGVINGDAQIYNLSRVYSWLLNGTIFLTSHGNGYHAYMSIGHDLLYVLDSSFGSTYGLGLVCWSENIALFLLVVSTLSKSERVDNIGVSSTGIWSGFLYMAIPLFYFQASSVKNDLAVTLFGMLFFVSTYRLFSGAGRKSRVGVAITALTFGLSTYHVKSYGVLAAVAVVPVVVMFFAFRGKKQHQMTFRKEVMASERKGIALKSIVVMGLVTLLIAFSMHVQRYWAIDKAKTVSTYTTGLFQGKGLDMQALTNPFRIIYELVIQLPMPMRVDELPGMGFLGEYSGPYTYSFGGYFGEDIAWCGLGFLIISSYGVSRYIVRADKRWRTLSGFIFLTSFIYIVLMGLCVLWQPWYSRFIGIFYIGVIGIAAQGLEGVKLERKKLIFWMGLAYYATLMAAVKGLAIVAYLQFINKDYYSLKSHGMTKDEVRLAVRKDLNIKQQRQKVSICIEGGPTLYIMREIYLQIKKGGYAEVIFPSRRECKILINGNEGISSEFKNVAIIKEDGVID